MLMRTGFGILAAQGGLTVRAFFRNHLTDIFGGKGLLLVPFMARLTACRFLGPDPVKQLPGLVKRIRACDFGFSTNRHGIPHLTVMSKCGEVFPGILGQGSKFDLRNIWGSEQLHASWYALSRPIRSTKFLNFRERVLPKTYHIKCLSHLPRVQAREHLASNSSSTPI